ncbi:O-antigen ligase family protein [Acidaminobacter hydrogenoformans]|uniref:O-antigen ligase like membrane protein n=1 Tax=Acidaminobacter hydrogenoformans DSM 2784 TaxID=1120920 RepID=A0A1G5S5H1_9FIRM|nr:O-antigen ligase family protein [Acidaminobacter hydrogenoformans]SCZ81397.1 hypothetical protein SAMN03080599_02779 [Acidaminobacter hydrogenoformans DSM 2784]
MIRTRWKVNNIVLFIVLFMSILPFINIGSFGVPVLYLLTPLVGVIFLLVIFGKMKIPPVTKHLIVICLLIITEVFISTFHGTIIAFNRFIFPTDSIQYVTRFLFFIAFIALFYRRYFDEQKFVKYFLIVMNIGMLIGVLQWVPWPGRELFVKAYPFTKADIQLAQLSRELYSIRVHGIAQFATANGGLATFFFVFGYSVYKYYKEHKYLSICLMILSVINVIASQARAGILSLVSAIIIFYIVDIYISRKSLKPTLSIATVIVLLYFGVVYLYNQGNPIINKMIYRWTVLFETSGGARILQIQNSLSMLNTFGDYLWGISRAVQSHSGIGFHIEVEPINIFVLYGLIGFILQYSLVLFLLVYFMKNFRKVKESRTVQSLTVASFVGLFSYQIFSVGYFFFREIRIGLFPWLLMGTALGVIERYKRYGGIR